MREQIAAWHRAHVSNGPTEAANNLASVEAQVIGFQPVGRVADLGIEGLKYGVALHDALYGLWALFCDFRQCCCTSSLADDKAKLDALAFALTKDMVFDTEHDAYREALAAFTAFICGDLQS